jgi:hypothetical protein
VLVCDKDSCGRVLDCHFGDQYGLVCCMWIQDVWKFLIKLVWELVWKVCSSYILVSL